MPPAWLRARVRARLLRRLGRGDVLFRTITQASALGVLIVLGAIFTSLVIGAALALDTFGLQFFVTNPESCNRKIRRTRPDSRHACHILHRTVDRHSGWARRCYIPDRAMPSHASPADRHCHRALAGVPSIIYGIWGLFVFAPFLQQYVQPALIAVLGPIPGLSSLFAGASLWDWCSDGKLDPVDHGASLHYGRQP